MPQSLFDQHSRDWGKLAAVKNFCEAVHLLRDRQ
jgi:hypothetical protein